MSKPIGEVIVDEKTPRLFLFDPLPEQFIGGIRAVKICRASDLQKAMRERDELLAALKTCLDGIKTYAPDYMHGLPKSKYIDRADRAIAACDSQQIGTRKFVLINADELIAEKG